MHPIAFTLGPLTVRWYGVMIATAFALGLWTASRRALRYGVAAEKVLDFGPWLILGSIIGARILYVFTFWREIFAKDPAEIFKVWHGGLVFYGGLIGACITTIVYARARQLELWNFADILSPSIALGYVFGRIGCFLNGCCFGRSCSLPWAVRYPVSHETHGLPVHPTQIYDSLLNLALYAFLAWLYRRKSFRGQVFAAYLVCYAITRSTVEMFRGDYPVNQHFFGGWATPAHLVSIGILAFGVVLFAVLPRAGLSPQNKPA